MFVHRSSIHFPTRALRVVAELSEVRAEFRRWLREAGVETELVDDLSVVLSELGANAVRETPQDADAATVEASIDGDRLELTVANEVSPSPETNDIADWDLRDPLRTGGRGLLLVSAFVEDVQVDVVDRRLVVRCITTL